MSRLSDEQKIRIVKMRVFLYTCYWVKRFRHTAVPVRSAGKEDIKA